MACSILPSRDAKGDDPPLPRKGLIEILLDGFGRDRKRMMKKCPQFGNTKQV
jgi:hypothetical protein